MTNRDLLRHLLSQSNGLIRSLEMSTAGRGIQWVSVSQVLLAVTHLEDELSESIWVLVIEQESVAGVGRPGLKEEQEELVPGRTALKKAEYQLQKPTQLQRTQPQLHLGTFT